MGTTKRIAVITAALLLGCHPEPHPGASTPPAVRAAQPAPEPGSPAAAAAAAPAAPVAAPPAPEPAVRAAARVAAPPLRCTVAAGPVTVATTARAPGPVTVAQRGTRTALAWADGAVGWVAVLGADGAPAAAPIAVNERGTIAYPSVRAFGSAFLVDYVHKHGSRMQGCDQVVRTLGLDGALGEPVVLVSDVCAFTRYPAVGARDDVVVVAAAMGYEGRGLRLLRWTLGGAAEVVGTPGSAEQTSPLEVGASPEGLVALWTEPGLRDDTLVRLQRLDPEGRATGGPVAVGGGGGATVTLLAGQPFLLRVRRGALELRAAGGAPREGWTAVDAGGPVREAALVHQGGRPWARALLRDGGVRIVPLTGAGAAAGPPSALSAADFAIDGTHGAAAGFGPGSRDLVFSSLSCASE